MCLMGEKLMDNKKQNPDIKVEGVLLLPFCFNPR